MTELRVERHSESGCADCGLRRSLIGPLTLDGELKTGADMVCVACADGRLSGE